MYQDGDEPVPPVVFGGVVGCEHQWGEPAAHGRRGNRGTSGTGGNLHPMLDATGTGVGSGDSGSTCLLCGAWRGSLGAEPLHDCLAWARGEAPCPVCYVCHLRTVAADVWRVLRDDGTFWCNLADSYQAGSKRAGRNDHETMYANGGELAQQRKTDEKQPQCEECGRMMSWDGVGWNCTHAPKTYKPTDLCGIPQRAGLALQADGWYWRSDVIWAKPNPQPESVTSRPAKSHEHVLMFTKRPGSQAYFDMEAVKEIGASGTSDLNKMAEQREREGGKAKTLEDPLVAASSATNIGHKRGVGDPGRRNLRDVWTIPCRGSSVAHFALFPLELPARCIRASTSERGCCPECGAPWRRVVERTDAPDTSAKGSRFDAGKTAARDGGNRTQPGERRTKRTVTWEPGCACGREDVVPATVLDCFGGAGTTALAAQKLGRRFVLCEISQQYAEMAANRIRAGGDEKLMADFAGAARNGQEAMALE